VGGHDRARLERLPQSDAFHSLRSYSEGVVVAPLQMDLPQVEILWCYIAVCISVRTSWCWLRRDGDATQISLT
jgi:hypothetical protein